MVVSLLFHPYRLGLTFYFYSITIDFYEINNAWCNDIVICNIIVSSEIKSFME